MTPKRFFIFPSLCNGDKIYFAIYVASYVLLNDRIYATHPAPKHTSAHTCGTAYSLTVYETTIDQSGMTGRSPINQPPRGAVAH